MHFWAIEKDKGFEHILQELIPEGHIIRNDVLQVDLDSISVDLKTTLVYGSLPYYITSPIISKLFLTQSKENKDATIGIPVGVFIVQKEFAEKVHTLAKKKSYLWRLLNYEHIVTYHKTIPAK